MPETASDTAARRGEEPRPDGESRVPDDASDVDDTGLDAAGLRREAAKWRRELRATQTANDELRAEIERRRVESESEQDRAIREAVEAERQRLTGEFAGERLQNRLRVRAVGKLREPDDAVLHLAGSLDADVDDAALDEAIDGLVKQRDYLAAPAANGVGDRAGLVTQGARSQAPGGGREQTPDDWIRARAHNH